MAKENKYIEAVGRRKTAVARVRITEAKQNSFTINSRTIDDYFKTPALQNAATEAILKHAENIKKNFSVSAKVIGGGVNAQAEAIRHGIARALIKFDAELRPELKNAGFLKRDPRMVERKKFGLKKARRAAQWSKR